MMKFSTQMIIASLAVAIVAQTSPAQACEVIHALEQKTASGETRISLNGAYIEKFGPDTQVSVPFTQWLTSGTNTVMVEYIGTGEAVFELKRGCKGGFPEGPALETKVLNASGEVRFSFDHVSNREDIFLKADQLDGGADASLNEAIAQFRKAIDQRDADTVIRYAAPMFREIKRLGYPVRQYEGMLRAVIESGEVTAQDGVAAQPVVTGNIVQFINANFEPMIVARLQMDGASMTVPLGTFWGRFDGVWGVVQN